MSAFHACHYIWVFLCLGFSTIHLRIPGHYVSLLDTSLPTMSYMYCYVCHSSSFVTGVCGQLIAKWNSWCCSRISVPWWRRRGRRVYSDCHGEIYLVYAYFTVVSNQFFWCVFMHCVCLCRRWWSLIFTHSLLNTYLKYQTGEYISWTDNIPLSFATFAILDAVTLLCSNCAS